MSELPKGLSENHPLLQGNLLSAETKQLLNVLQSETRLDEKAFTLLCSKSEHEYLQTISSLEELNDLFVEGRDALNVEIMQACIDLLQQYAEEFGELQEEAIVREFMEENSINEIDKRFLELSEDMRLLIAKQFNKDRKYNFGCGGSFGYFKTPTGCGGCISGKKSLERCGLDHLAEFKGSRQYCIPQARIKQAKNNIFAESSQMDEKHIESISKMQEVYSKQLRICKNILENKSAIEKIQKTNPTLSDQFIVDNLHDFLVHIQNIDDCQGIIVDPESCVVAYIQGTSRYYGSGGCEYGNYVAAWFDGERKDTHVVFRDAYNSAKDNRNLSFDSVSIESIQEDESELSVSVSAKSKNTSRTYSFQFAKENKDLSDQLDEEQQEDFARKFDKAKQDILLEKKREHSEKTMPFYCLPDEAQWQGMPTEDVPYQQPKVTSSAFDKAHGKGVVVVQSQIDHAAGAHKMQWEWEVFLIEHNKDVRSLQRECRWHNEIQAGQTVHLDADDILYNL